MNKNFNVIEIRINVNLDVPKNLINIKMVKKDIKMDKVRINVYIVISLKIEIELVIIVLEENLDNLKDWFLID